MPADPQQSPRSSTATAQRRAAAAIERFGRAFDEINEAAEAVDRAVKIAALVGVPVEPLKLLPWARPHHATIDAAVAREPTEDERLEARGLLERDERRRADAEAEAKRAREQLERRDRHDRRRRNVADGLPPEQTERDAGSPLLRELADRHAAVQG